MGIKSAPQLQDRGDEGAWGTMDAWNERWLRAAKLGLPIAIALSATGAPSGPVSVSSSPIPATGRQGPGESPGATGTGVRDL